MSEKIGYPNPNYTEEDVGRAPVQLEQTIDADEIVIIHPGEYRELCSKAAALDILSASLHRTGEVNDDLVWAVTGAKAEPEVEKLKKEIADRFDWYWREKNRADKLQEHVDALEIRLKEMQEQLNAMSPAVEEEDNHGQN